MAVISELEVKISAQMGEVTSQIAALKKQLEGVQQTSQKTQSSVSNFSSVLSMIKGLGITKALYQIGKAAITSAAELEQNTIAIKVLTGSAETASQILDDLRKQAAATPFETADLIEASKLLLNYGIEAEKVTSTIDMLSNVASGSAEKLQRISMAYGQIVSSGRLQGQDLLQLINAGFNPLNEIAKKTGETMAQLRKRMEAGGISAQEVAEAFKSATSAGGQFYKMNEEQSKTVAGLWSTLVDEIKNTGISIGQAVEPFTKWLLAALTDSIKDTKYVISETVKASSNGLNILGGLFTDIKETVFETNTQLYGQDEIISSMAGKTKFMVKDWLTMLQAMYPIQKMQQVKPPAIVDPEKYKAGQKAFADLMDGFEKDKVKRSSDSQKQINLDYQIANEKLLAMQYISDDQRLKAKAALEDEFRARRVEAEKQSYMQIAQLAISSTSQIVGQAGAVISQYYANKNTIIENDRTNALNKISETYEAEKLAIENSVLSAQEKTKALKDLDDKRTRDEKIANDKADKEKKKLAREQFKYQKAISVTQAIINTAQAVTAALTAGPIIGPILAGIIGALGSAQVALIAAQEPPALAEGGFFQGPALIGEKGREFAFPLDGQEGRNAMREMAGAILDVMSQSVDRSATISNSQSLSSGGGGNVYLDGTLVGRWIQDATKNGAIFIDERSIV